MFSHDSKSLEHRVQKQSHLSEKVKKIVEKESYVSSADIAEAVALLSDVLSQNMSVVSSGDTSNFLLSSFGLGGGVKHNGYMVGPTTLRSVITHRQIVEVNRQFLNELGTVTSELDIIGSDVDAVLLDIESAYKQLNECRITNQQILEKAQTLQMARMHVRMKHRIASKLEEELKVSDSSVRFFINATKQLPSPLDLESALELLRVDFFNGIEDIERVRRNANILIQLIDSLTSAREATRNNKDITDRTEIDILQEVEDAETTTGLSKVAAVDILQESSELLEVAYEKLFFICAAIIRALPDPSPLLLAPQASVNPFALGKPQTISNSIQSSPSERPQSLEEREVAHPLQRALQLLRSQPEYLDLISTDLAKKRRQLLQQRFHDHLAHRRSIPSQPRSGEMSIYETPRYIGDMCAFVHEAAALEREFAEAVMGLPQEPQESSVPCLSTKDIGVVDGIQDGKGTSLGAAQVEPTLNGGRNVDIPSSYAARDVDNSNIASIEKTFGQRNNDARLVATVTDTGTTLNFKCIVDAVDFVFEGIIPAFRVRVEEALGRSKSSPVELCQSQQILNFYMQLLTPVMGGTATGLKCKAIDKTASLECHTENVEPRIPLFVRCCTDLKQESYELFRAAWEAQTLRLASLPTSDLWTSDLSLPPFLHRSIGTLVDVLTAYQASPSCSAGTSNLQIFSELKDEEAEELSSVISAAITPLLNFCRQAAQYLPSDSSSIYLLNCYSYIHSALAPYKAASQYVDICSSLISEQMIQLVEVQTNSVLEKLGFLKKLEALREWNKQSEEVKERRPLSSISSLHPLSLPACLKSFYNALFSMNAISLGHLDKISSRTLRAESRHSVLTAIADAYEELYYGTISTGAPTHTPEQIRALLDL